MRNIAGEPRKSGESGRLVCSIKGMEVRALVARCSYVGGTEKHSAKDVYIEV